MADLGILRPEVREAVERADGWWTTTHMDWNIIRAELLRLATRNAALEAKATRDFEWNTELLAANKQAEAELAESRETIKRLNRRVQVAEAGIAEKVKGSDGRSFGRSLANAAADMFMHERDEAQAELAALKARIAEAQECGVVALCGGGASLSHEPYPSLVGKRVRLVEEE